MTNQILLTGGTGFIGRNFLKEANDSVYTYVRSEISKKKLSNFKNIHIINTLDRLPKKIDFVIHLAAQVHEMNKKKENIALYSKVNVNFTLKIAHLAIQHSVRKFIFVSSVKVYGNKSGFYTETDSPNPDDLYGISKFEAEQKLIDLFKKYPDKELIILRIPMVYGPGNKGNIFSLLKLAKYPLPMPIGSSEKRSFLYVQNLVSALKKILNSPKQQNIQLFNITDDHDLSVKTLFSHIKKEMGMHPYFINLPNFFWKILKNHSNKLINAYQFSSKLFQKTYDWTPPYTPEEGLAKTVEWFNQ